MSFTIESFPVASPLYGDFLGVAEYIYAGDPFWCPPAEPLSEMSPRCFLVRNSTGVAVGRACGVINRSIVGSPGPLAAIGWYECIDDDGGAKILLDGVCDHFRAAGFTSVSGPLDGSTWHRYRFAEPRVDPPFFLDLYNKPWYTGQWEANGFVESAAYHSTLFEGLDDSYQDVDDQEQRLREHGVAIRQFRPESFEEDLRILYDLSIEGFAGNYLFSPILYEEFAAMYRPVERLMRPEWVLIAQVGERPVGFVFAIDDIYFQAGRRLVMKSAALLSEWRGLGLGHHLLERIHRSAWEAGYQQIVHALMHDANRSAKILSARSRTLQRYRLFEKELKG